MRAKATLLGHPIHPMLIVFPLGLLSDANLDAPNSLSGRSSAERLTRSARFVICTAEGDQSCSYCNDKKPRAVVQEFAGT
jgi:hypothetical protein